MEYVFSDSSKDFDSSANTKPRVLLHLKKKNNNQEAKFDKIFFEEPWSEHNSNALACDFDRFMFSSFNMENLFGFHLLVGN
jgi:hypothetical protein